MARPRIDVIRCQQRQPEIPCKPRPALACDFVNAIWQGYLRGSRGCMDAQDVSVFLPPRNRPLLRAWLRAASGRFTQAGKQGEPGTEPSSQGGSPRFVGGATGAMCKVSKVSRLEQGEPGEPRAARHSPPNQLKPPHSSSPPVCPDTYLQCIASALICFICIARTLFHGIFKVPGRPADPTPLHPQATTKNPWHCSSRPSQYPCSEMDLSR